MRAVSIEELAEHTDELIAEAAAGTRLTLLRGGKAVADIVPHKPEPTAEQREDARERLMELLDSGLDLGAKPFTYEERHGR